MNKSIKYIAYAIVFAACQSQVMAKEKEPHMKCMNKDSEEHCDKHICKDHGGWASIMSSTPPYMGATHYEERKAKACHHKRKKWLCICSK